MIAPFRVTITTERGTSDLLNEVKQWLRLHDPEGKEAAWEYEWQVSLLPLVRCPLVITVDFEKARTAMLFRLIFG